MESPSSETGDNMSIHETNAAAITSRSKEDSAKQSQVHGESTIPCTSSIAADAGEYNMGHERRGWAIILNHEKFKEGGPPERTGTNEDKIRLKQCFERLKFEVDVLNDLKFHEIKNKLEEISRASHRDEDCLIVAVLTHGYKKNSLHAYDDHYETSTLFSSFTADVCPQLAGKPKIFIIQACRGEEISKAVNLKGNVQVDSYKVNSSGIIQHYSIPVEADQLVAFSAYEGRAALRDTGDGTWFIQELCKELEDNGEMLDLLTMFTNINRRVAVKVDDGEGSKMKQMPVVQSTLTRKLFFSSTIIRSRMTITPDITNLIRKTNDKLNYITRMLESRQTSLSVPKVKSTRKQSSLNWDDLQVSKETMTNPLPQGEAVYKLAEALKMFLQDEADRLEQFQKENGELILDFLSCWDNLNENLKRSGYKKLHVFLNEYAKNWKMYKILYIPDSSTVGGPQVSRHGSQIDAPDAGSFRHVSSTIPCRISPTRKSTTQKKQ